MATAIEYYPNGQVKRVEFGRRETVMPGASGTEPVGITPPMRLPDGHVSYRFIWPHEADAEKTWSLP